MVINVTDRIADCKKKIMEMTEEIQDYNTLIMCISTLAEVNREPDKYKINNRQEEIDYVVNTIKDICSKHEIVLPEYIEWGAIEMR